jgi:hypothetical protein
VRFGARGRGLLDWRKESSRRRCYRSRLIKIPDRISERPPREAVFLIARRFANWHLGQFNVAR